MDKELQTPRIRKLATTGVGHFGEAGEEGGQDPLSCDPSPTSSAQALGIAAYLRI